MYDDLSLFTKNVKNNPNSDSTEADTVKLTIYYKRLTQSLNELYRLVRDNYSFIINKEEELGVEEKRFIEIMGNVLAEAGNAKDIIEKIINAKETDF